MLNRFKSFIPGNDLWSKTISFSIILLFVFTADAILSYWVPVYLEKVYNDTLKVGYIISASSVVGLLADLIFPQILRGITVKRLVVLSIITSLFFSIPLLTTTWAPLLLSFVFAMGAWGIYFELIKFAEQQFVADTIPIRFHSAGWGIIVIFRSLSYFLGPIIAGTFISESIRTPVIIALFLEIAALGLIHYFGSAHERPLKIEIRNVNIFSEFSHWFVLIRHVWPIVILSTMMGFIDASFWTLGPIISEKTAVSNHFGGILMSVYMLPSIFMGLIVSKLKIFHGKKRLAIGLFLLAGIFLTLLGSATNYLLQLFLVFILSVLMSSAYPLSDAVYSDIVSRMGRERQHLIGLSSSTFSLAYIFGPTLSGLGASYFSEIRTLGIIGYFCVFMGFFLLFFTPRKLKVPQKQIEKWK